MLTRYFCSATAEKTYTSATKHGDLFLTIAHQTTGFIEVVCFLKNQDLITYS